MSDNVTVLETEHRTYHEDRDWSHGRQSAEVVRLTPKFLRCTICHGDTHRASSCPKRKRDVRRPGY